MSIKYNYLFFLLLSVAFIQCNDDEMPEPQSVEGVEDCLGTTYTTGEASLASDSEVRVQSKILTLGTDQIIEHGHLIKKGQIPTVDDYDNFSSLGIKSIASDFTSTFPNLDHSSKYYTVAYITYNSGACYHSNHNEISTPIKNFAQVRTLNFTANQNGVVDVTAVIDETFGEDVIRWGFVYTAGNNPPDFNNATIVVDQNLTTGVISHGFSTSISDLDNDKIYTISAFAENNAGITIADPIKIHRHDFDFQNFNLSNAAFTLILDESFNDNTNNWPEGTSSGGVVFDLRSGYYRIKTTDDSGGYVTFENPENILQGLDNYQIDLTIDFTQGGNDGYSGLYFEGTDSYQQYLFGIIKGAYVVGYWNNLDIWEQLKWDDNINDIGNNLLTVRKVDGVFYLYVNEVFVYTFDDFAFDGYTVRFRAGSNATIDFEELTIRKIL